MNDEPPSAPHVRRMVVAFCVLLACWGVLQALDVATFFGVQQMLAEEDVVASMRAEQTRETIDELVELRRLGTGRFGAARVARDDEGDAEQEKIRRLRERIDTREGAVEREHEEERVEARATNLEGRRRAVRTTWINFRVGIVLTITKTIALITLCWSGVRVVLSRDATTRWRIVGALGACVVLFVMISVSPLSERGPAFLVFLLQALSPIRGGAFG